MPKPPLHPNLALIGHFGGLSPQSHSQPYGSALTATFNIPPTGCYYCMSVIYERTMNIIYDIALTPNEWSKISFDLHKKGLNLISKYKWNSDIDETSYGRHEVVTTSNNYIVNIDGVDAINNRYLSDAKSIVEQLEKNTNYDVEYRTIETTTKDSVWVKPEGRWFYFDYENMVGIQRLHPAPELLYNDLVTMRTTLLNDNSQVELQFIVTYETDGIQTKGAIEEMCVNTPLSDMGAIQYHIEDSLGNYAVIGEPIIECYFDAKTESRSECTPDIIAKTRAAKLRARNEEE